MKPATALLCAVLGAAAITGALYLRPPSQASVTGQGELVFPGLAEQLPAATRVSISSATGSMLMVRQTDHWSIADRDFYPAQTPKLRQLFAGLAGLKLRDPRTADPSLFARLGVDDPTTKGSTAVLVKVENTAGDVLAQVILGHSSLRSRGGLPESVYIRRPGEDQSWLAEGKLAADADPQAWLPRDILSIAHDKIADVVVTRGASRVELAGAGGKFSLVAPPPGKIDDVKVDETSQALENLTLSDVKKGELPGTAEGQAVFTTTDGLAITVTIAKDGKLIWASFAASGPGADAYQDLAGWAFQLPDWREASLLPALADIVTAPPAKAAGTK
jgi:hypothetical protein